MVIQAVWRLALTGSCFTMPRQKLATREEQTSLYVLRKHTTILRMADSIILVPQETFTKRECACAPMSATVLSGGFDSKSGQI